MQASDNVHRVSPANAEYLSAPVVFHPGKGNNDVVVPFCPAMKSNQWRVVLTWGSTPEDLDLHVMTSTGHVYHEHATSSDGLLQFERDERHGFGPETALVTTSFKGLCHVFVHHVRCSPVRLANKCSTTGRGCCLIRKLWCGYSRRRVVCTASSALWTVAGGTGTSACWTAPGRLSSSQTRCKITHRCMYFKGCSSARPTCTSCG